MIPIEQLLQKLMSIPSISGNEEAIGEYIFNLLTQEGFTTKKIFVDDKRFVVQATVGTPKLYLAAHMDTVPPMIDFSEDNEYIYGRGSCDTKGSIATMVYAAIESKRKKLSNFGLLFTTGEETFFDGAKKVMAEKINIPFVVVGEPTSLEIVNGHFGILVLKVNAKGKAAHSSRPEEGINAIDMLTDMIVKIRSIQVHQESIMSLTITSGGTADNIIPAHASATYCFRISPKDSQDYLKEFQSRAITGITIETIQAVESCYCEVPKELDFIEKRRTVKYFTELSFFKKGVVIGPGDIKYAHGVDEKVPKKELHNAVILYKTIINHFCQK